MCNATKHNLLTSISPKREAKTACKELAKRSQQKVRANGLPLCCLGECGELESFRLEGAAAASSWSGMERLGPWYEYHGPKGSQGHAYHHFDEHHDLRTMATICHHTEAMSMAVNGAGCCWVQVSADTSKGKQKARGKLSKHTQMISDASDLMWLQCCSPCAARGLGGPQYTTKIVNRMRFYFISHSHTSKVQIGTLQVQIQQCRRNMGNICGYDFNHVQSRHHKIHKLH